MIERVQLAVFVVELVFAFKNFKLELEHENLMDLALLLFIGLADSLRYEAAQCGKLAEVFGIAIRALNLQSRGDV